LTDIDLIEYINLGLYELPNDLINFIYSEIYWNETDVNWGNTKEMKM